MILEYLRSSRIQLFTHLVSRVLIHQLRDTTVAQSTTLATKRLVQFHCIYVDFRIVDFLKVHRFYLLIVISVPVRLDIRVENAVDFSQCLVPGCSPRIIKWISLIC